MFKRLDYLGHGILSGVKLPRAVRLLLGEASGSATLEEERCGSRKRRWLLMEGFCLELPRVGELLIE